MDNRDDRVAPANDAADSEHAAEAQTPEARIAALEAELADSKDRVLRALAEAENTRRRAERERADMQKYAISGFAKDLLASADNLRRALDSVAGAEPADDKTRGLIDLRG
jgi:molecular chaperone GrpE